MNSSLKLRRVLAISSIAFLLLGGVVSTASAKGQATTKSTVWFAPGLNTLYEIDGALSKVTRTNSGISVQFRSRELTPGHAYTLLLAVFNYPENCIGFTGSPDVLPEPQCGLADLGYASDVVSDILLLGGNVVGNSGRAAIAGHIKMGDNSDSIMFPLLPAGLQPHGLQNSMGAEFHIILLSHGPMLPEFMPDMIHTYLGGCENQPVALFPNEPFPLWGERGPNVCNIQQEAFNLAPTQ